jgi:hypothetical protein
LSDFNAELPAIRLSLLESYDTFLLMIMKPLSKLQKKQETGKMVTLEDLEDGARPRITEREFAALRGCSQSTLQKERVAGKGPQFLKDPITGRIYYEARAVIEYFQRAQVCQSTCEYETGHYHSRLTKARTVLKLKERFSTHKNCGTRDQQ